MFLAELARRQLVLVTGKGGVGKSALAAALGLRLAASAGGGRRILLVEVDPRENAHQMLGVQPSGGDIVAAGGGLFLQHLEPRRVIDRLVSQQVRFEWLAERVRRSPVYQHFVAAAPGLKELAVLGQSLQLVRGEVPGVERFDAVVLDAPATGHGVNLVVAPQLVSDVIAGGPFARMTRDVATWVADPERAAVVVVSLAEEMPVTEALELAEQLERRVGRRPELLVVNGLYPPWRQANGPEDLLGELWRDRRRVNERELERLAAAWRGPRLELPLLPLPRGRALAAALAARLGGEG